MIRPLLLTFIAFIFSFIPLSGADYYWIGNSGDWTDLNNWVISAGSTTNHTTLPGINDDVYFDNNSFSAPNQVVTIPANVNLSGIAVIRNLTFINIGSLQPIIQGANLHVHGDVTLGQNVRILSEFHTISNTRDVDIEIAGGYFRHFFTGGTSFTSIIKDSLVCGTLQLMTANLNASNVIIRADTLKSWESLTVVSTPHFVDLSGSKLFLKNLHLKPNLFLNIDFTESTIYLNGVMKVCGGYNFNTIIFDESGIIDNRLNSTCSQAGFATFTIDSLFVNNNAQVEIVSDNTDNSILRINYFQTEFNSHLTSSRNLEVSRLEINGRFEVLSYLLQVEQLLMKKNSELVLAPTIGNNPRVRVIAEWEIDGECSERVYVRSSIYGSVARMDVSAFMLFSYAQIVDIEIMGGGPQQIENSIKAGKTSGLNLIGTIGKKFYWVGNSGDWSNPNNWSMTDGGMAGTCVPGILDTVIFTNNSFDAVGYKITTNKSSLFVRHFDCVNNNVPFEFEGNNTKFYILGTALFRKNIHFTNPTSIYMIGSDNTGELLFAGEQNINKLEIRDYTTFDFNLNSDSLVMPDCEFNVSNGVSLVSTGILLQTKNTIFTYVNSSISLEEFRTEKLYNFGDSDNVFNSLSTILYISDEAEFYGAPVGISSLRYSGDKGCFVNLFDRLDTIRYERPASFFTYTDTIRPPGFIRSSWAFINELGLPGVSKLKGMEATEGLILGDVDYRDCEFDFLNVGIVKKMTLSGNLRINKRFRNNSNCNNISYFMKNEDSMSRYYQLYSDADSLVFEGFHIYSIDAVGTARFVANNGKDMGNNNGWTFRNQIGKKYYWVGKTGEYMNPSNWSLSSNGSPSTCIPTLLDTVIFDRFSFSSSSDTVFLPTFAIPVRCWMVESDVVGLPVFHSSENSILYVTKDFRQLAPTTWSNLVRVSFLTNRDTSRISNKHHSPKVILAMGHQGIFNRFLLEDTLSVKDIWMGFGTFLANNKPIYAESFVADTASGYSVGEVRGFSHITNTYMEVDRLNAFQEFGIFGFLRGRADMSGTTVQCRSFNMSFNKGLHPQKVEFPANIEGILRIGEEGFHGGRIDSIIAYGNLKVLSVDSIMPPGYLFADYLSVDGFLDAHAPLNVMEAFLNSDAYFKTFHNFEYLYLSKNKTYEFDPNTSLNYYNIYASSSSCEPITIIGKKSGQRFLFQKNPGGVFNGQGVRMRDCISGGGVSFMGTQATDLGNNVDWVAGRPNNFSLTDFSQDFVLCKSDSVFIYVQSLYPNGLEYKLKIDNNDFDPGQFGFFLKQPGHYTLEVKYTDDCSLYDTAMVDIFTNDSLDLGNDTLLCQGEIVTLAPKVKEEWTLLWSNGSRRPTLSLNKGGMIWLRVTNSTGCSIADTVDVGFFLKPKNPAGLDTIVCSSDNYLTGNFHKGFSYEWSTGDTVPQIPVGSGGTFTLKMGNGICYVEDTVVVQVDDPVYFSIGSDTVLLEGSNYTLTPDKDLPNYLWNTGSTTKEINVNTSGSYILTTSLGKCKTSDTAIVRFRPMPKVYFEKDTIFLCDGETTDIKPIVPQPVLSYNWNTGSTDSVLLNQGVKGMYIVEVRDSFFTNSDSIYLYVQNAFSLDLGNDTALCVGQKLSLQSNENAATYIWNTGSTSPQIEVETTGLYKLKIELDYCKAEDSIYVEFQEIPFVDLLDDTLVCEDKVISVNIFKTGYSYNWNDGNTSAQRTFTTPGTYTVTVRQGVCQDVFSTTISHQAKPEFFLGNDTAICDNVPLFISAKRDFALSYFWENGFDGPDRTITEAGVYGVFLTDGICEVYGEIEVSKLETPKLDLGSDTSICNDGIIEIIPTVSQSDLNYLWNDGTTSDRLFVYDTGTFILEVNNGFCFATDTILVYTCDCNVVYVPTAFSPNGDGLNDGFRPSECFMGAYKLQVFNRWGQMVFESTNPQEEWDGTHNGNECPSGAYLYKLYYKALYENGARNKDYNLTGTVNLVR